MQINNVEKNLQESKTTFCLCLFEASIDTIILVPNWKKQY